MLDFPRSIDVATTFNELVEWFYDKIIMEKNAPGLLVGLSGTDSLVTFCAAATAFEKAGRPDRLLGVHFAPSEDFVADYPEAEIHFWFRDQVVPWLKKRFPESQIVIDSSIDWRKDGLRWGALMDMSVVAEDKRRTMRAREEQYWVVGTRNKTEDTLLNYSNASTAVSLQPLIHLWKNEILKISEYLDIPQIAIDKSCETDCICGRDRLAANNIQEVDWILMVNGNEVSPKFLEQIAPDLRLRLTKYILSQMMQNTFKVSLPYTPPSSVIKVRDPLVVDFENGTLNLKEFNHKKHLYIAWYYLREMPLETAVNLYCFHLQKILNAAGKSQKFNMDITNNYFNRLSEAIKNFPTNNFDELFEKFQTSLTAGHISA